MRLFGLEITRTKAAVEPLGLAEWNSGPWVSSIREAFAGAWQRGITYDKPALLKQSTVWACVTLIVQDIGKLGVDLIELKDGIWVPTTNSAYSTVLRKPNHYQGWIKFIEAWVTSKLTTGNTYVLKERNNRGGPGAGNVTGMYVLNPERVTVLVAPRGDVFYQLGSDNLAGLEQAVVVPATEIIHDVDFIPYHHLCGLPPLTAAADAAGHSLTIQKSSARFFANNSRPGGVLTAPASISDETAKRIKEHWEANYSGEENVGKVAVLGNGLTYEAMAVNAVDSDLAKQLAWADEKICGVYHVPPFMVGVGDQPTYDNIAKFTIQYYQQALQERIECIEECLDLGLGLPATLGIRINIDNLIRMDQTTLMESLEKGKNYLKPNEGRQRLNLPPVDGGDAVYRQQQDFSLPALAKRDAKTDPFAKAPKPTPAAPVSADDDTDKAARVIRFRARAKAMADRYRGDDVERAS